MMSKDVGKMPAALQIRMETATPVEMTTRLPRRPRAARLFAHRLEAAKQPADDP